MESKNDKQVVIIIVIILIVQLENSNSNWSEHGYEYNQVGRHTIDVIVI